MIALISAMDLAAIALISWAFGWLDSFMVHIKAATTNPCSPPFGGQKRDSDYRRKSSAAAIRLSADLSPTRMIVTSPACQETA